MQITIDYQQIFLLMGISYGLPLAIYISFVHKKYGSNKDTRSKVLKFFWFISLILLAQAITPIAREILYPSSNIKFSQNEIYKGVLLIFSTLLILGFGYVVGFFLKKEDMPDSTSEIQISNITTEQQPIADSNQNFNKKNTFTLFENISGAIKGFKDGMNEANSNSKAEFFDVNGGREEKKSRTLSDYLWQSIISLAIATGCGFGVYFNLIVEINLLISVPCMVGFIVFFILSIIYAIRFKQVVDESGISIMDFFWELVFLAAFVSLAVALARKEGYLIF